MFAPLLSPLLVLSLALAAWNLSITIRGNARHSPEELICQRVATTSYLVERGELADAEFFTGTIEDLAEEPVPALADQASELHAAVEARSTADTDEALENLSDRCETE